MVRGARDLPLLKCICIFTSNMHLRNTQKSRIYHDSPKCICIFDFVFSPAPEGAVPYQEGGNKETLSSERGMLYRLNLKTIYNFLRMSGHGGRSGSARTDRKLKSNMHMHLAGGA